TLSGNLYIGNQETGTGRSIGGIIDEFYISDNPYPKQYNSTKRLEQGIQYTNPSELTITTGTAVTSGTGHTSIGTDGADSSGAYNIATAGTDGDEAVIALGQIEHKPNIVLHDFPYTSGDGAVDYLISHWKCDDDAASSVVLATAGDNANWEVTSTRVDRNTDNDSGGYYLDTKNLYFIDIPCGSGTVYDNDFYRKGGVLIKFKPQFTYDVAGDQQIWELNVDGTDDRILLHYYATDNEFQIMLEWGNANRVWANVSDTYSDNISLQQWIVVLAYWDSDRDLLQVVFNGKLYSFKNAETPSTSHPAVFTVGCSDSYGSQADIFIADVKTFSEPILPYGAYFTGNSGTTQLASGLYHKDITLYTPLNSLTSATLNNNSILSGSDMTVTGSPSLAVGVDGITDSAMEFNASGEYVSVPFNNNINPTTFSISLWYKYTTGTLGYTRLFASDEGNTKFELLRYNSDTDLRFYIGGIAFEGLTTIHSIFDGAWHHIKISCYKVTNYFITMVIDGINYGNEEHGVSTEPILTSNNLLIGNRENGTEACLGIIDEFYITSDPNTPQIMTASGVPLDYPIIRND
ncbi:LamG domain-containing protein, partial [Candidatus Babeliales bacterium]|nr:LamG domain-containing protein [Candidatus Babeliales bacterium]